MSVTRVLLDILVVLVAAKVAAELVERARIPAVVGEILAGILIGPSVLGFVHSGEVLRVLGELGVILLLLDVGFEMDIAELGAVGRASLAVATVGVIVPLVTGIAVASGFGLSGKEALFVGAALTATSVGITARVFGDLRALATSEARTVLGAAVADDVMGLVILTVVVRIVTQGSVSSAAIASIVGVAVAFLVVTTVLGVRLAPALFAVVNRVSRSNGTLVAIALAFTLGIAELASAAKLAPIVGAFVAGVSLARSPVAGRIRRELTPVGHLFIPVFFLQIGIDARIGEFFHAKVLGLAAALLVVAIVGKLASAAGMWRSPGDRLLVGIGMIPRGEVGLIFAALGLRQNVFGRDIYAALLLVVLATTLLTPPLLRLRVLAVRGRASAPAPSSAKPAGGWLQPDARQDGAFDLAASPPLNEALPLAFGAATLAQRHRIGSRLLDWLGQLPDVELPWTRDARDRFFELLAHGGPRSWRFLVVTGVLHRALPELAEALERRAADPFELDPYGALRWTILSQLLEHGTFDGLPHPERAVLAALVVDAADGDEDPVQLARRLAQRVDIDAAAEESIAQAVRDVSLLSAAARRIDGLDEERVLQLAVHLGSEEQADILYELTLAANNLTDWERKRVSILHERIHDVLRHPELTGRSARGIVDQRREEAQLMVSSEAARERIAVAPRVYVLATAAADLARQATMCEPPPRGDDVRVAVFPLAGGEWKVEVAAHDRVGLLARETAALAAAGLDVRDAVIATWGDGCAIGSFLVESAGSPDGDAIAADLRLRLRAPVTPAPVPDAVVVFDDDASPWHTICQVQAADQPGLLAAVTAAFSSAGASVQRASVRTSRAIAIDVFELTDRSGNKLGEDMQALIRTTLHEGAGKGRRGLLRRRVTPPIHNGTNLKQSSHGAETWIP